MRLVLLGLACFTIVFQTNLQAQEDLDSLAIDIAAIKTNINLEPISSKAATDLAISFAPVSPDTLNFNAIKRAQGQLADHYSPIPESVDDLYSPEYHRLIDAGLNYLRSNSKLSEEEIAAFIERTRYPAQSSLDFFYDLGEQPEFRSNPFYVDSNYLIVFSVTISNKTNQMQRISNQFGLSNGLSNLQMALSKQEIIDHQRIDAFDTKGVMQSYYGMVSPLDFHHILGEIYMPDELFLPPGAEAHKLVAFYPSIINSRKLHIFHGTNISEAHFSVDQKIERLAKTEYFIHLPHEFFYGDAYFEGEELNIVSTDYPIYQEDGEFFISVDDVGTPTDLLILVADYKEIFFGRITGFRFRDYIRTRDYEVDMVQKQLVKLELE